jgi:hypothetical protein
LSQFSEYLRSFPGAGAWGISAREKTGRGRKDCPKKGKEFSFTIPQKNGTIFLPSLERSLRYEKTFYAA